MPLSGGCHPPKAVFGRRLVLGDSGDFEEGPDASEGDCDGVSACCARDMDLEDEGDDSASRMGGSPCVVDRTEEPTSCISLSLSLSTIPWDSSLASSGAEFSAKY
mmetsp:Transcript_24947/g.59997  ORF Transcript_24947/g.59997 Transcript_24947/m.59997 type:complete len:105 (+) Transcript_24947:1425-1739(+)